MWSFVSVAFIEPWAGIWQVLVTLEKDGVPESFFVSFAVEPTAQQAAVEGAALAARMNGAT